jgi:hypothetical protein
MAQLQLQLQSTGSAAGSPLASGDVRAWTHHRVLLRRGWADPWTPVDYLECLGFSESAAPSIPTATLRYRSGRIKREDQDEFAATTPKLFNDWFVRVELLARKSATEDGDLAGQGGNQLPGNADGAAAPLHVWHGVIVDNAVAMGGSGHGRMSDQTLTALGLEYLLDLRTIRGSFVYDGGEPARAAGQELRELDTTIPFNERLVRGLSEIGNRTADKLELDDEHQSHAFDGSAGASAWTILDAVEYLLTFFGPSEPEFVLGGQADALGDIVLPRFDLAGRTVHEALVELINPRRGFAWCVECADQTDDDGNTTTRAQIRVFSVTDVPISMGDATIPANTDAADVELDQRLDIAAASLEFDSRASYGKVIVTGERVLSCFTLSIADDTLQKGWTEAEETAYRGVTAADETDADALRESAYPQVFSRLRVHPDWAWKVAASPGGSGSSGSGGDRLPVNPAIKFDGSLDRNDQGTVAQGAYRNWGIDLERSLPIQKPTLDSSFRPEYLEPFILVKDTDAKWRMLDAVPGQLRMLDSELGLEVRTNPPHRLAKGSWSGAAASGFDPDNPPAGQSSFDYRVLLATVAARTDQQLRVIADVPVAPLPGETAAQTQARRDQLARRVLHMHVPDAELWYVVPGTVTNVDAAGNLLRHAGEPVVRDDVARLRKLAAAAMAWYGRIRSALDVTIRDYLPAYRVGSYVRGVTDTTGAIAVHSVVTAKSFDLLSGTTRIATSYAELDFGADLPSRRAQSMDMARIAHRLVPR